MQVALTFWEGRISPLFDATRMLLIVEIEGSRILAKRFESLACESALSRATRLKDLGVETLICGGISNFFANLIEAQGIRIVPFASGSVGDALESYLIGNGYRKNQPTKRCKNCTRGGRPKSRRSEKTTKGMKTKRKTSVSATKESLMSKIAISSEAPDLDGPLDPRFGRAAGFMIVDPQTFAFEYVDNGASQARAQGAGIQAAETVAGTGAKAVLTGYVGPKAFQALQAAGIKVGQNLSDLTVRQAVERFNEGRIDWADQPNRQGHGR